MIILKNDKYVICEIGSDETLSNDIKEVFDSVYDKNGEWFFVEGRNQQRRLLGVRIGGDVRVIKNFISGYMSGYITDNGTTRIEHSRHVISQRLDVLWKTEESSFYCDHAKYLNPKKWTVVDISNYLTDDEKASLRPSIIKLNEPSEAISRAMNKIINSRLKEDSND